MTAAKFSFFNSACSFMIGHLSSVQTQVRKSAPSRARSQGGRSLPQRRPPSLLSSRCPVPAAATPPLNPGHPAPFSAKLFHQVKSTTRRSFFFFYNQLFTLFSFCSLFILTFFSAFPPHSAAADAVLWLRLFRCAKMCRWQICQI